MIRLLRQAVQSDSWFAEGRTVISQTNPWWAEDASVREIPKALAALKRETIEVADSLRGAGIPAEQATIFALSLYNLWGVRGVLDEFSRAIDERKVALRQSTLFRAVYVEGEFESSAALWIEEFAALSRAASNLQSVDLSVLLKCTQDLIAELGMLFAHLQFEEPSVHESDLQRWALVLPALLADNRTTLSSGLGLAEATAVIASSLGLQSSS